MCLTSGQTCGRNPKISGTTHNVFGIQTGVAIGFFVREKARLGQCGIHYARREDAELAKDKLAYLREATMNGVEFETITPDKRNEWLNQSNSDFERLIPLANRETKFAKTEEEEQAVFKLSALGVNTARDEWVYDFDVANLRAKALSFADIYNELLDNNDNSYSTSIKWSRDLRNEFRRGRQIVYSEANARSIVISPVCRKAPLCRFHDERCSHQESL